MHVAQNTVRWIIIIDWSFRFIQLNEEQTHACNIGRIVKPGNWYSWSNNKHYANLFFMHSDEIMFCHVWAHKCCDCHTVERSYQYDNLSYLMIIINCAIKYKNTNHTCINMFSTRAIFMSIKPDSEKYKFYNVTTK